MPIIIMQIQRRPKQVKHARLHAYLSPIQNGRSGIFKMMVSSVELIGISIIDFTRKYYGMG